MLLSYLWSCHDSNTCTDSRNNATCTQNKFHIYHSILSLIALTLSYAQFHDSILDLIHKDVNYLSYVYFLLHTILHYKILWTFISCTPLPLRFEALINRPSNTLLLLIRLYYLAWFPCLCRAFLICDTSAHIYDMFAGIKILYVSKF